MFRATVAGLPEHFASGILLEFGGVGFLATAAHCIDKSNIQNIAISTGDLLYKLPTSGAKGHDPFDVAYLRLPSDLSHELRKTGVFIGAEDIDPDDVALSGARYTFVGFPCSKTSRIVGSRQFIAKRWILTGPTLAADALARVNLDPEVMVAIEFQRERILNPRGARIIAPEPEGGSGGGFFRVSRLPETNKPVECKLVGLGTRYPPHAVHLEGVRIGVLLHMLKETNPDVAKFVPLSRRRAFAGRQVE